MTLIKTILTSLVLTFSASQGFADSEILNHDFGGGRFNDFQPQSPYVQIHCASRNYYYQNCPAMGRIARAYLISQQSHSACIEGQSWGYTFDSVWVDRGCEADFQVELFEDYNRPPVSPRPPYPPPRPPYPPPHHPPHHPPYPPPQPPRPPHPYPPQPPYNPPVYEEYINCSSNSYRYVECESPSGRYIRDAFLVRKNSNTECTRGYSWGVSNRGVWVDKGCRAEFKLLY